MAAKDARPFEQSVLLPRADWLRCSRCGATFGTREGLRSHRRWGRCPAIRDELDNPTLSTEEIRRLAHRWLLELTGARP